MAISLANASALLRRLALQLALWAGPLGVGLALLLLLARAPYFNPGPDVPSAGDERAWGAMWGALGFVGTGCAIGVATNLAWLAGAWRRAHRPNALEWLRAGVNFAFGSGLLWFLFRA